MTRSMIALFSLSVLIYSVGCGAKVTDAPSTIAVHGIVTLDGSPLADAYITFEPQENGAASTGVTDEKGEYSLVYSATQKGAVAGNHVVRISKLKSDMGEETLSPNYNVKSKLSATVSADNNKIDFDLTSKPSK